MGAKRQVSDEVEESTPAARRSAIVGFCSCKTGIHAIHGNKLSAPIVDRCRGRLNRVFQIDIDKSAGLPICTVEGCREAVGYRDVSDETCAACGGAVRIMPKVVAAIVGQALASIEDPVVVGKIQAHAGEAEPGGKVVRLPGPCAPPDGWG